MKKIDAGVCSMFCCIIKKASENEKKKKKVSSATSTESKPDRHNSANLPSAFKDLFSLAYHYTFGRLNNCGKSTS